MKFNVYYSEGIGQAKPFRYFTNRYVCFTGTRAECEAYVKTWNHYRATWQIEEAR